MEEVPQDLLTGLFRGLFIHFEDKLVTKAYIMQRNSRHVWDTTFYTVSAILSNYPLADDYIVFDNACELTLPVSKMNN